MKTSSAKSKGRRCSQELKDLLLKHAPHLENDDIIVTPSGVTGPDVMLSPLAKKFYPITSECKNVEALNIWKALEQSESHAKNTQLEPILFFKRNRTKLYACLDAEQLVKLLTLLNKNVKVGE